MGFESVFRSEKIKGLVGQSLSSLCSAAFQHLSACRRRHSLAESVYLASLSFLGLISSFHIRSPTLRFFSCFYFFRRLSHDNAFYYIAIFLFRQAISKRFIDFFTSNFKRTRSF